MANTTKSYATESKIPEKCISGHDCAPQKDLSQIYLVTPYTIDNDKAFTGAVLAPELDGRAVCLPQQEYKRMRTVDLSSKEIKTICTTPAPIVDDFWQDFGVGIIVGAALASLAIKSGH